MRAALGDLSSKQTAAFFIKERGWMSQQPQPPSSRKVGIRIWKDHGWSNQPERRFTVSSTVGCLQGTTFTPLSRLVALKIGHLFVTVWVGFVMLLHEMLAYRA
jgi:hypothetical protein